MNKKGNHYGKLQIDDRKFKVDRKFKDCKNRQIIEVTTDPDVLLIKKIEVVIAGMEQVIFELEHIDVDKIERFVDEPDGRRYMTLKEVIYANSRFKMMEGVIFKIADMIEEIEVVDFY